MINQSHKKANQSFSKGNIVELSNRDQNRKFVCSNQPQNPEQVRSHFIN